MPNLKITTLTPLAIGALMAATLPSKAGDAPAGVTSLLADQITGINVVSLNEEPRRVEGPAGQRWSFDTMDQGAILAQTRCAGYNMAHGEMWKFCEMTPSNGNEPEYFWQDANGALVVGPVEWD